LGFTANRDFFVIGSHGLGVV